MKLREPPTSVVMAEAEGGLGVAASERRVGSWPWPEVGKVDRVRAQCVGARP